MNGSRRRAGWRLVALAGLLCLLGAPAAFAQSQKVRVRIGPASVYEHPRSSSAVLMTLSEGTVLEVLAREGDWYWVVLPPDAHGTKRAGYVPAYLCERVGDRAKPEPGLGAPATHSGVPLAASTANLHQPRMLVGLGAGGQFASANFQDTVTFRLYQEAGQYTASYVTKNASAFDMTIGVRLGQQMVLAFAFWRAKPETVASAVARVPHPLKSYQQRTASGTGFSTGRTETDGHLQITYLVPLTHRMDLSIFAGPSVFYVRQDLIDAFGYREAYPYDTVSIDGFAASRKSKAVVGAHIGADLTCMIWRFVGVGIGGRYARGSMNLPSAGNGVVPVEVGGTQLSGGVRMRF